ncbi:tyrosine-type recombinase/integrase [Hymenobacter sp. BT683]|uniref:Tyrosine-type recombinase/integrase n=1 Tax=Hymenobacter jeongseonensis TaxID=2791027 RepID=A0ABS0IMF0_9BACT|nr:tyrosine-type recombinase/integrase [Hymenobacter jeongseonensis]MBF9239535.1 tyrosine-type recombinase/integrase [Hymenobacter jeongseonensis]
MQKTRDAVVIKMTTRPLEILSLYQKQGVEPSDYIFPFLSSVRDYSTPKVLFKALSSATTYVNKDLKTIARRAKLDVPISFHSSRHTFATLAISKGMPIEYVSKLLRHASIKTTQIYAKVEKA